MSLPRAVVADANVVLSALIGGRARDVLLASRAPACMAPDAVADEVAEHLPTLARKRGLDLDLLLAVLTVMPISWRAASEYEAQRAEAERRIAKRDPDDWPTVALALTHDIPIWSQDRDLEVAGPPLFTTGQLLDAIRTSG